MLLAREQRAPLLPSFHGRQQCSFSMRKPPFLLLRILLTILPLCRPINPQRLGRDVKAIFLYSRRANRPQLSIRHIAEKPLGDGREVRAHRHRILAHLLRAVLREVTHGKRLAENLFDSPLALPIIPRMPLLLVDLPAFQVSAIRIRPVTPIDALVRLLQRPGHVRSAGVGIILVRVPCVFHGGMEDLRIRVGHDFRPESHSRRVLAQSVRVVAILPDDARVGGEVADVHGHALCDDVVGMICVQPRASDRTVRPLKYVVTLGPLRAARICHVACPSPLLAVSRDRNRGKADGVVFLHDDGDVVGVCGAFPVLVVVDGGLEGFTFADVSVCVAVVLGDAAAAFVPEGDVWDAAAAAYTDGD